MTTTVTCLVPVVLTTLAAACLSYGCGSDTTTQSTPVSSNSGGVGGAVATPGPGPTAAGTPGTPSGQQTGVAGAASRPPSMGAVGAAGSAAGQAGSAIAGASSALPSAGTVAAAGSPSTAGTGGSAGAGGAAAPAACDPADKSDPPKVIDFVATEYANFEVGAINFEPSAVTGMDTPNTGPYEPIIEVYPYFDQFTIYRPAQIEKPLQVIAWGNGGCSKHGTLHGDFLKELASYGYMIIADGAPGEKDNRGFGGPMSPMDETQQKIMLDWVFEENERPCSPFYHQLDLAHLAVAGNSCGGLMTMYAAPDPRIATAVLFNSGLFSRDQAVYDALHAPMAIFNGGPEDFAGANGELDFGAINNIPIFISNDKRGHGSYLWDDNASETGRIAVAWFNWMLRGDEGLTGKGMFVGDDCGMCMKPEVWIDMKWKNLALLK